MAELNRVGRSEEVEPRREINKTLCRESVVMCGNEEL